tara:strand:- start:405 stop:557 length:153 start_codon:yes stop_codon:yes gene_type:complete
MKNIRMNQWIKTYIGRGLSLEDAQYAARWRAGHWKLSARMEKIMDDLGEL